MKKIIFLLSFSFLFSIAKNNNKIYFNEISKISFKNRDDLKSYTYSQQASKQDERIALAGYLPQITISTKLGAIAPDILINQDTNLQQLYPNSTSRKGVSISFSQLLLSGGVPVIDYRIAKEGTRIIKTQMDTSRNNIQFNTENAFLDLKQKLLEEQYIAAQNETSQIIFEKKSSEKTVGFLNNSEWLKSVSDYSNTKKDTKNYLYDIETSLNKLQRETNTKIQLKDINLSLDGISNIKLKHIDYYIQTAIRIRPELKTQKHLIKQARLSEKRYRRSYVPTISAYAQAADVKFGNNVRSANWTAGIDLSWSFDGLANAHSATKYEHKEIEYIMIKKDLELQIIKNIKITYNQIKTIINQLKAMIIENEQSITNLYLKKEQYNVGNASRSDLSQANLTYKSTEFSLNALKIDLRTAYQNLIYLSGYPKEFDKSVRL